MSSLLNPPKVELKFSLVNFPELMYGWMNHNVFAIIYKNRERLTQQHKPDEVKTACLWLRGKMLELLSDQGPPPALTNMEHAVVPQVHEGG